jgi:hypothetical protein
MGADRDGRRPVFFPQTTLPAQAFLISPFFGYFKLLTNLFFHSGLPPFLELQQPLFKPAKFSFLRTTVPQVSNSVAGAQKQFAS